MTAEQNQLAIVMPVYNEQGAIQKVLDSWIQMLQENQIKGRIHVYNDGSKDQTLQIMLEHYSNNSYVSIHDKKNSGHGPTILKGYCDNLDSRWIFQIDSDDELGPEDFMKIWTRREDYDFLICSREGRASPLSRTAITFVARNIVNLFYGKGIFDVNSPFRLMRTEKFANLFQQIPKDTFAPNVIVSGFACLKKLRLYEGQAFFRDRTTGEVSIKKWKLAKAAFKSFLQTIQFRAQLEK
jgi:dolichol-phosphate mannosyltransferase